MNIIKTDIWKISLDGEVFLEDEFNSEKEAVEYLKSNFGYLQGIYDTDKICGYVGRVVETELTIEDIYDVNVAGFVIEELEYNICDEVGNTDPEPCVLAIPDQEHLNTYIAPIIFEFIQKYGQIKPTSIVVDIKKVL